MEVLSIWCHTTLRVLFGTLLSKTAHASYSLTPHCRQTRTINSWQSLHEHAKCSTNPEPRSNTDDRYEDVDLKDPQQETLRLALRPSVRDSGERTIVDSNVHAAHTETTHMHATAMSFYNRCQSPIRVSHPLGLATIGPLYQRAVGLGLSGVQEFGVPSVLAMRRAFSTRFV